MTRLPEKAAFYVYYRFQAVLILAYPPVACHMIHKIINAEGESRAMTDTGSAELKYRRYIQKKRITPPAEEKAIGEPEEDSKNVFKPEPETRSFPAPWPEKETGSLPYKGELTRPVLECKNRLMTSGEVILSDTLTALRKQDHSLYRKLYTRQKYKAPAYPSGKSYTSQRTQIEDNRATLMAIKVIKQALACFAILGIIVLMQGREDMQDALAAIRKHVVETHIDPQNLIDGVKSVFSQLVRTLGGSP